MTKARAKLGSNNGVGIFAVEPVPPPLPLPMPDARRDREGRKPMPFWTTEAAKKQLRMMAAEMDTSQQDLMTEALNMLFVKHGKPPIA